jgi:DNA (cytosine-5)-methyltransferase 1
VRLLDLFCGAGGAAAGYAKVGFEVVGVDINRQPNYPFEFHQADAMTYSLDGFDAVHASPPCQGYSWGTRKGREDKWPLLIGDVRDRLTETGLPWVIENVTSAHGDMRDPVLLCGQMFGLGVVRHRLFEMSDPPAMTLGHPRCQGLVRSGRAVTVAGHGGDNQKGKGGRAQLRAAMGIDWMSDLELRESIPPAYTEWIGGLLIGSLERAA